MSAATGVDLVVDVIVNNHNYGRFLASALESALDQTHPHVNVIAVDDGSTDESREVLAEYADRVEVVLKEQGGQASAINAGFARTRGDVVIFLDSDDRLDPEATARVAAAFAADESLVKVQFRTEVIDAEGRGTGVVRPLPHLPMPEGDLRRDELLRPFDIVWMSTSANSFRRPALERIMPVPEASYPKTGADWYLVHTAALLGRVRSLPEVSGYYRIHGENSYEADQPVLDLKRVRQAISYTEATGPELLRVAEELGLLHPRRILSTADIGYRMISVCIDRSRHPVPGERRLGLLADGIRALARRDDVTLPMKAIMGGWFAAMAVSPPRIARRLAEFFLFPESRTGVNGLLGRLHRRQPAAQEGLA
jgi:GT2 family glycosyltransferase